MTRNQIMILILILAAAFLLRAYFIPAPGYERDIQLFKIWSQNAAQFGASNVYDKTWCDYQPLYLYVLKAVGSIYRVFYPDFREHTYLFDLLIKLPAILADILISIIIFFFLRRKFSYRVSLAGMSAFAFNPAIFFNSAYWGQMDSIPILFGLLAILALTLERSYLAWIAITIAIFIKMQMVVLLPILILVTWQRKGIRTLLGGFGVSWLTFVLTLLPFIYYHKIDRIIDRVFSAVGEYPFLSMNAYNLWWLIGLGQSRKISDLHVVLNLFTYRTLGTLLFALFFIALLAYLYRKKGDEQALFLCSSLAFFGFFMLPTEMHERYILGLFPFLLIPAIKDKMMRIIFGFLSFTAFFNLFISLVRTFPENFTPFTAFFCQKLPVDILISMINVAVLIYFLFILLKDIKLKYLACSLGAIFILLFGFYIPKQHGPVFLSDLEPSKYSQQWGRLMKDRSIDGNRPTVNGFIYEKGIGTHASSSITYILDGRYRYLDGAVGLDDEQNRGNKIEFFVYADDTLIYDSGILQGVIDPRTLYLNIAGAKELKLVVGDGGDGINCDHADWLTMELLP